MRISRFFARAVFPLAVVILAVPDARGAYIVSVQQVGPDVVATGSGSLDTTDLTSFTHGSDAGTPYIDPAGISLSLGPSGLTDVYELPTAPGSWGPGTFHRADSNTGNTVMFSSDQLLFVPEFYASGTDLGTSTDTFSGQTFATLGLTPGTYFYHWGGGGVDADSFTVQVGPAPEPASLSLLALAGLPLLRRRQRASLPTTNRG